MFNWMWIDDPVDPCKIDRRKMKKGFGLPLVARPEQPYQPGDVYLIKYMGHPCIATIQARDEHSVKFWGETRSVEHFNAIAVCFLGRRIRLFGRWLTWARICPETLVRNDLPYSLAKDVDFWNVSREALETAIGKEAMDAYIGETPFNPGPSHAPDH